MIQENRYYSDLKAVKELDTPEEVTNHIKAKEWELLKITERTSSQGTVGGGVLVTTKLVYVVGLKEGAPPPQPARLDTPPKPAAQSTDSSTNSTKTPPNGAFTADDLDSLDWMDSDYGGQWIPKDKVPGMAEKFMKDHGEKYAKGWKMKVDEYTYYYTAGAGNLKRYLPEDSQK